MEWGPAGWKFLHTITFAYPNTPTMEQQQAAKQLFMSLQETLPCKMCQGHYQEYIQNHPVPVTNAVDLQKWLVDLHNSVNQRLHKPLVTWEEAKQIYTTPKKSSSMTTTFLILTGLLILVLILILKKNKSVK